MNKAISERRENEISIVDEVNQPATTTTTTTTTTSSSPLMTPITRSLLFTSPRWPSLSIQHSTAATPFIFIFFYLEEEEEEEEEKVFSMKNKRSVEQIQAETMPQLIAAAAAVA